MGLNVDPTIEWFQQIQWIQLYIQVRAMPPLPQSNITRAGGIHRILIDPVISTYPIDPMDQTDQMD